MKAGTAIRAWRRARGMSQYKLADRAGLQRPQVASWEAGRHSPTARSLELIARCFGIDVGLLLAGPDAIEVKQQNPNETTAYRRVPMYSSVADFIHGTNPDTAEIPNVMLPSDACILARITEDMASPELRPGDRVLFERIQRRPAAGSIALVVRPEGESFPPRGWALGVVGQQDGEDVLRPINPDYPIIHGPFRYLARVITLYRDYRDGYSR